MTWTLPTNLNSYAQLFQYMNTVTNGFFWAGVTIAVWITTFMALKNFHTEKASANAYVYGVMLLLAALSVFVLK